MTNISTDSYENQSTPDAVQVEAQRRHIAHRLMGVEQLQVTHPFTLEVAWRAYRINDFLHRLVIPEHRERFVNRPDELYDEYQLTEAERDLIDRRDWIGLTHYGVIFFSLEKMAAVIGQSNADIYAQMRGESLEEFQASRNVSMKYSVSVGERARELDRD